ncbi:hypothetical protein [uncultured Mediterranean phage uvMED]|nr:hypothetical protein [uncultured Mediterranean phage uvMED]BAQ84463.1 hypothetical protein [uncultured Mediterranean phage uvMED]BAQ84486.1 hypothetical protein [uncultured Mediterranean phage uvMED]BAR14652.1 hypothetical protein [uncultured Mediterranean phage uvMED]BAR14732.1 hypothetical protein [uncultured Mediterranean phage uvMED]
MSKFKLIRTHSGLFWDDIAQDFPEFKSYKEAMNYYVELFKERGLITYGKRKRKR